MSILLVVGQFMVLVVVRIGYPSSLGFCCFVLQMDNMVY